MHAVRYGIPLALLLAGVIVSATAGGVGIAAGDVRYRIGVEGDKERDTEQSARDFFDEHGHWPDEPASAARGRRRGL